MRLSVLAGHTAAAADDSAAVETEVAMGRGERPPSCQPQKVCVKATLYDRRRQPQDAQGLPPPGATGSNANSGAVTLRPTRSASRRKGATGHDGTPR